MRVDSSGYGVRLRATGCVGTGLAPPAAAKGQVMFTDEGDAIYAPAPPTPLLSGPALHYGVRHPARCSAQRLCTAFPQHCNSVAGMLIVDRVGRERMCHMNASHLGFYHVMGRRTAGLRQQG